MEKILHYYFNLHNWQLSFPALLGGALVTLKLAAATVLLRIPLGLVLAMARAYRIRLSVS